MLTVVLCKWARIPTGHQLPHVCDYTADHVVTMCSMLSRHLTLPHRVLLLTDDPRDEQRVDCEVAPMFPPLPAGGCFHRLELFGDHVRPLVGDRFAWIDLDCVITGNVDHVFGIDADFAIKRYDYPDRPAQLYNGALCLMDTGSRRHVWEAFDPVDSPAAVKRARDAKAVVGSDQAWISMMLGPGERTWGPEVGVHEAMLVGNNLPSDARLVFFSGPRDPSQFSYGWVNEHYR